MAVDGGAIAQAERKWARPERHSHGPNGMRPALLFLVLATPMAAAADVVSGEGANIERCLGGSSRDPEVTRGRWYGWQIIVTEAASVVAVPVAAGIDSPGLAIVGISGAILSPAIVHMAHGNPGRGAASVGIHLGMGLAGLLLGTVIVPDNHNDDVMNLAGPALGLFVSQVVATTIDVASFAYEEPPSRFAVGALLAPAGRDPRTVRKQVSGLQLSLRF